MIPPVLTPPGADTAVPPAPVSGATATVEPSPWLTVRPGAEVGLRLFCLHHAGGAASWFRDWQARLGPEVQVLPVQLPGRERRVQEPRVRDMDVLVRELDRELDPYLSQPEVPYALYGHSMGALVAYRLARHRAAEGRSMPVVLLAGAHPAPQRPQRLREVPEVSEGELVEWLVGIGGLSRQLLHHSEWLRWALSLVRDDLALCASHDPGDVDRLPLPLHVFTGHDDPLVTAGDAEAWAELTSVSCDVHRLPGGHFFPRDAGVDDFFDRLSGVLSHGTPFDHRSLSGRTSP
ncbi:thioesterase [Streptomyces sp. RM72]|uniref:thioesterase II family protein n=1 Tax=unclassified Streptomyces TaxID=2593676 RepID=UPI000EF5AD35|nr:MULTISPECIES: alpha/beta fold hydrolase [unclassified Streptomyces]MBQ0891361.1 thioesterase [Streptomyces sp. RM72]